jgi:beta-glucanase (GH16 family)
MHKHSLLTALLASFLFLYSCSSNENSEAESQDPDRKEMIIQLEDFSSDSSIYAEDGKSILLLENEWIAFELDVQVAGRYRAEINAKSDSNCTLWIEDYYDNTDDRTYDITGKIHFSKSLKNDFEARFKDGSPLNVGKHKMKLHVSEGSAKIDWIRFSLIQKHRDTERVYEQAMNGKEWNLTWSDEFDGTGLPDSTKWSYNIGNWGWGNNEPQYFTSSRLENARVEDGNLIIEARKNDLGNEWTSARLTTQGKESFLYGKIEIRAKVPVTRGTWAAGWLLGDEYRDELSWPYCGEIDILECVGYEINDSTGNGKNHATCHTRAYYFKQGNQIGSEITVSAMNTEFHTYAIEWYPDVIYGFLDGEKYYTYDKNKDELEWPFFKAQNIILNLTVGGGWGGLKGIDESVENHQYIIDYVRVYELTE